MAEKKKNDDVELERSLWDLVPRDGLIGRGSGFIGQATGVGAVTSAARTSKAYWSESGGRIKRMLSNILRREPVDALPTDSTDGHERFRVAQEAYGRSDEEVAALADVTRSRFWTYVILSILGLAWGVWNVPTGYASFGPLGVAFSFITLLITVPGAIRASYYHYQLRHLRIGGFREWSQDASAWMPPKRPGRGAGVNLGSLVLFGVITSAMIAAPDVAMALTPDDLLGAPANGSRDYFYRLLQWMLPGVGPITADGAAAALSPYAGPLANAMRAFNSVLLIFASGMIGWHSLSGMVATAHEGKFFGGKYHSIWAPARLTVGVGFLAPIAGGGYCMAQVIVLQLILLGGNVANVVWSGFLSTWGGANVEEGLNESLDWNANVNPVDIQQLRGQALLIVQNIAEKELCYAAVEMSDQHAGRISTRSTATSIESSALVPSLGDLATKKVPQVGLIETAKAIGSVASNILDNGNLSTTGGPWNKYVWDYGELCGQIAWGYEEYEYRARMDQDNAAFQKIGGIRNEIGKHLVATFDQLRQGPIRTWAQAYAASIVGAANDEVAFKPGEGNDAFPALPPALKQALQSIYKQLREVVPSAVTKMKQELGAELAGDLIKQSAETGWAGAGVYYRSFADLMYEAGKAIDMQPEVTAIDPEMLSETSRIHHVLFGNPQKQESHGGDYGVLGSYWRSMDSASRSVMLSSSYDLGTVGVRDNPDGFFSRFMNDSMVWVLESMGELDPGRPLESMVRLGHTIIEFAWGILAAIAGYNATTKGASGMLAAIPFVGDGLSKAVGNIVSALSAPMITLASIVGWGLLVAGIVHAYVLPMMPYFFWFMFVVGLLVLTVEAVVAAPIWAFFHVRMDGQDFVDQVQKPGYMIAFNLVTRPSMALFGLILSYSVFGAAAWFFNETFTQAAVSATAGREVEILGILAMLIIAIYVHWQIALRSFTLISELPDRVSRWFGQGGESLGESEEAKRAVGFIVSKTEGNVGEKMKGTLGAAGAGQGPGKQKLAGG